jgi:hypothetical protein
VDDLVVVEVVPSSLEASLLCGILRDAGIECFDRPTNFAAGALDGYTSGGGQREIVVRGEDEQVARETLAQQRRG